MTSANPLGCYDERRYDSYDEMIAEVMTVFDPPQFPGEAST